MAYTFHFLEDIATADLAFDATGDSLEEVFQGATDALIDAMADPETVGAIWQQSIELADEDPATLLFEWLSDLVYWKDAAGVVFSKASLTLHHQDQGMWMLDGMLYGAPVDGARQDLRDDVKGVTKHLYRLTQQGSQWIVRVVLDV
ncbi:MAG: archease [Nitrospira sp.]